MTTAGDTKVLVIDDEEAQGAYLCNLLETLGYSVSIALGGAQGIEKLENESPDIVLADLVMPEVNGLAVLRHARDQRLDTPVIIITAYESLESALEAMRLGAFDYISKPIKIDLLRSTLKRAQETKARRQAEQRLAQRARDLAALHRATQAITASLEPAQVLRAILQEVTHTLGADAASVLLKDFETGELVFQAGSDDPQPLIGARLAPGQGIAGWVAEHGKSLQVDDVLADPHFYRGFDQESGYKTRNLLAVPLRARGQVIGVIEAVNKLAGTFAPGDLELLESLALTASAAIENARLFKEATERLQQLQQTQAQLEAAARMATAGDLARGVAHEINNALTPVLGTSSLLLNRPDLEDDLRADLQIIAQSIQRVRKQVKQFAELARSREFRYTRIDLNEMTRSALGFFAERLQRTDMNASLELAPDLPPIKGNTMWLNQALLHLMLNAIEAMPEGGQLTVRTYTQQAQASSPPSVCVSVTDTGVGIPAEHREQIFDIGFTTKTEQGHMRGLGIGLFDVRNIIQAHGGRVEVESRPDRGSTFTLIFPVDAPLSPGNPRQESP
jgi:signal transduction histidine kinase/DNA-binding response OmpR family regulator